MATMGLKLKSYDKLQFEITNLTTKTYLQQQKIEELQTRIDKAIEIYEKRTTCEYKKKRFMEDKSTSDLMYEILKGEKNLSFYETNRLKIYEKYCEKYPEEITSDFNLDEDGNEDYINEIIEDIWEEKC